MDQEILRHVDFGLRMMPAILIIVLASLARKLIARGWLVASVVVDLVLTVGYEIVNLLQYSQYDLRSQWYAVLGLVGTLGMACFAFFLFSNWIAGRIAIDSKCLIFSFSGRLPRAAFWIAVCILLPLGCLIGLAPLQGIHGLMTQENLPCVIFWILYGCLSILHIWISLALYARRWHDLDKSGWMTLILFVPIIGIFFFYGYLGFLRGTGGPNKYGEDPLDLQPDSAGILSTTGNA